METTTENKTTEASDDENNVLQKIGGAIERVVLGSWGWLPGWGRLLVFSILAVSLPLIAYAEIVNGVTSGGSAFLIIVELNTITLAIVWYLWIAFEGFIAVEDRLESGE